VTNRTQKEAKTPGSERETILSEKEEGQVQRALALVSKQIDLEESAVYTGAMKRRRVIQSGRTLLRLVMVYGLTDLSLAMVGVWATVLEWGSLSKSGVRKRLRQCREWMGYLILAVLQIGKLACPRSSPYHLQLIDVSNGSQPGSRKIDWRLHLALGLSGMRIDGVQLTDGSVGESLTHWTFQSDDLVLADRVYGVARSLGVLFAAAAHFVIRIGWQNLPLWDWEGQRFDLCAWLRTCSQDPAATPAQVKLWVKTPQARFPLRVVARAIPAQKVEKIRDNLRAEAKHKKRQVNEHSLLAAGFVMLVSNLPDCYSGAEILAFYRFRWQIELVFKRLKGLLCFDHLRATDPQLAQVYLLTKILIALLLGDAEWRLALAAGDAFLDPQHPISLWRLNQLVLTQFRQAVCGTLDWLKIQQHLPQLARYLCDEPRRRQKQFALFQEWATIYGF
jgi:hypothetical protein